MALKPVDTAIVMVVGPCIDDTNFKSLEESIAYNAAGMDISLIVEKTDGTSAVTAITLTTGGTSDWTHKDGGYYEVEITAAQNAEEGVAYVRGVCTGVLPFESAHYDIVKANIYDSFVKGTDLLQTDLTQIGGVAQSATDLKDFADAGYDPATNKVQGVVLTDTCTTLTGHTAQTGDSFARIGAAGASLTDLGGMSTGMKAEIESESNDALVAQKLDHLVAVADADDVVDNSIIAKMTSKGATADWSTFVNTTDAFEAIRDRGDAAWTTGAGGSDRLLMVDTTIATLASQTSFTLTAGSADDDAYNNCTIIIEDASTATQKAMGIISNYVGATKTVTLKYDPAIFTMATTDKVYILAENALKATLANRQLNVAADGDVAGNVDGSVASVAGHTAQTGDSYAIVNNGTYGNSAIETLVDELESRLTASRAGYLDNLSAGAVALASALATAQTDLNKITGSDGATLATAQALYAPNKVVPDAAGVAPTAIEIRQEIDSNSTQLTAIDTLTEAGGSGDLAAIKTQVDAILDLGRSSGVVSVTDSETTLFEDATPAKNKFGVVVKIDMAALQAADTFVVKEKYKDESGGSYQEVDSVEYTGVQSKPLRIIALTPYRYGAIITMQRTAGTNRSIEWESFVEE